MFDVACTIPYASFVIARQRRKTGDTWWYCVSVTVCMVVLQTDFRRDHWTSSSLDEIFVSALSRHVGYPSFIPN